MEDVQCVAYMNITGVVAADNAGCKLQCHTHTVALQKGHCCNYGHVV